MRAIVALSLFSLPVIASAAPAVSATGSCPGPATITVTGLTPGAGAAFLHGSGAGSDRIPGGPCADTLSGLAGLQFLSVVPDSDGDGTVTLSPTLPGPACARDLQVLDTADCSLSALLDVGAIGAGGGDDYWLFGNYEGTPTFFDGAVGYDGEVNCPDTCAFEGLEAVGARFVCNHWDGGASEGCDPSNDGEYGTANCGWMVRDGVELTENGNSEDCAYGSPGGIMDCVTGTCTEPVTWHAIECQCR
ncbi:MAG: hypothetical protein ACI8PZ_005159 [Myxococcota bacterium]|jgi:hypothetical protein